MEFIFSVIVGSVVGISTEDVIQKVLNIEKIVTDILDSIKLTSIA